MVEVTRRSRWGPGSTGSQLYYGPMYADTYAARNILRVGQVGPMTRQRMRAQHGRYLSGLGGQSPSGEIGYDPMYQGEETYDLEQQDDTFGSGIFDPGGRSGTSNPNMGVFASHYSLPGYLAREVPFTVSQDVTSVTSGAEVVVVPAGGMVAVEHRGKLTSPAVLGPTWVPPQNEPAGVTGRNQPYAFLTRPGQPSGALNPSAPQRPPPTYRPARNPSSWSAQVPVAPGSCAAPLSPAPQRLTSVQTVSPSGQGVAITPRNPVCGYGQEKEPASPMKVAFAGVLVGVGAGLLTLLVRKNK